MYGIHFVDDGTYASPSRGSHLFVIVAVYACMAMLLPSFKKKKKRVAVHASSEGDI